MNGWEALERSLDMCVPEEVPGELQRKRRGVPWFKEGKLLMDGEKYWTYCEACSGEMGLVVKNPGARDLGHYMGELVNCLGCARYEAELTPSCPQPTAMIISEPRGEEAGGHLSIQEPIKDLFRQCGHIATSFTTLIKDREPVSDNEHIELAQHDACCSPTLISAVTVDHGIDMVLAQNSSGEVPCRAELTLEGGSEDAAQERRIELGKKRKLWTLCKIHEDIGRGTFGVVKRVSRRDSKESFTAKFFPLRSSVRTRAFQERDLQTHLAHPRVAHLLDSFCTHRTLVLLTELYPSSSLLVNSEALSGLYQSANGYYQRRSHHSLDVSH
ncbi:hypothetical protein AAFF_G00354570 [Aldrovandia affinis]|uniref:Protein kinase domain-containing protein n=1 Tax=Aldrovandia affinis TaxID=143900 RepID=A0AAD7SJ04_9TELE|nr:hypothetical protein AAFF_G00354570 [Aldrovandia affinis]